jgi:hypothetical protein
VLRSAATEAPSGRGQVRGLAIANFSVSERAASEGGLLMDSKAEAQLRAALRERIREGNSGDDEALEGALDYLSDQTD